MQRRQLQGVSLGLWVCGSAGCYQGFSESAQELALTGSSGGEAEDGSEAGEDETGGSEAGGSDGGVHGIDGGAMPPVIVDPGDQVIDEDVAWHLAIDVTDPDGDAVRVWATGLPPGARWDEVERTLYFQPDFIQGGRAWTVTITADDGEHRRSRSFELEVLDTIAPPAPMVVDTVVFDDYTRLEVVQVTDEYLDSPGHAGREFTAYVCVPKTATAEAPMPVRISLHGIGAPAVKTGSYREFRIGPHDPNHTYWWGYDAALPDGEATGADVPDYTQRRTLNIVGWLLETYPEADGERVFVSGSSMGGAGALTHGLTRARHFAYLSAVLGQAIPRNHRPSRLAQLETLWGPSDGPLWDANDLTRVLRDSPEAQDQYLFVRHGKDDPTIHFGAVVMASPLTGETFYGALQGRGIGHLAVWDEGGHGPADPVLGGTWWDDDFSPIHDEVTFVRRDLAFPAFALSSADGDPGDGEGNGKQAWSNNAGYAGDYTVAGDTGWTGEIAGTLNRFLRWDATQVVDTLDGFAVPLHVHDGDGAAAPKSGYPSTGDRFDGELPVVVDVTPRRTQAFRLQPGERVAWTFGEARGEATADATGAVTVPGLALELEWQTLALTRVP